jgi:1-acyl-sn-glycerol-3-phosphate acyltransferase
MLVGMSDRGVAFTRPSERELAVALGMLAPWRRFTDPLFLGLEHIPADRPLLFVGNHTLYGVLDAPLLFAELYRQKGIFLRSLGDHAHFQVPGWRELLARFGTVDGTRDNCARLMEAGESILVFPGGGREVAKRRGEKYRLIWKERLGFARMALRHGATVVPFAAIGVEDAYDVVVDADDLMAGPLGPLLRALRVRADIVMPIARGALGPLPRRERFYFQFRPPVPTRAWGGDDGDVAARALRDRVRAEVEAGIAELQAVQAADPRRRPGRRPHRAR